jgi:hypothetical protein
MNPWNEHIRPIPASVRAYGGSQEVLPPQAPRENQLGTSRMSVKVRGCPSLEILGATIPTPEKQTQCIKTKPWRAPIAAPRSPLLQASRRSTQRRALRISLTVAPIVALRGRLKADAAAAQAPVQAAARTAARDRNVRCSRRAAVSAATKQRFRSSLARTSRCTAATASSRVQHIANA